MTETLVLLILMLILPGEHATLEDAAVPEGALSSSSSHTPQGSLPSIGRKSTGAVPATGKCNDQSTFQLSNF